MITEKEFQRAMDALRLLADKGRLTEITAARTLEELTQFEGMAIYNYEGTHYRLFASYEDGLKWLEAGDDTLVLFDSENESEIDEFLLLRTAQIRFARIQKLEAELMELKVRYNEMGNLRIKIAEEFQLQEDAESLRQSLLTEGTHSIVVPSDYGFAVIHSS
jgi:hypothetical protein